MCKQLWLLSVFVEKQQNFLFYPNVCDCQVGLLAQVITKSKFTRAKLISPFSKFANRKIKELIIPARLLNVNLGNLS